MIRIDHISFDFSVPDEHFAQNLYADWNHFCHRCFERVAEECLAPYGDDGILHELERLELDLGNIPEENFYHEFPRRLKEALQNALPSLHDLQAQANPRKTAVSRINNLLFQLEYGHLLPEWADTDFHLQKEIERLTDFSGTLYDTFIRKAALLCLKQEHTLRRLVCQTEQEKLLLDIFAASLAESSVGQADKRRLLALLLEVKSDIPIFFVHRTGDSNQLQGMSDLLETLSVRQLIRAETKEHAEVDLPPYWHYLYEWLVTYYPYNGIAMFGNKTEFTRHLHHRLLTFIHKRNGVPYLSKEELTIGFLLEVFGPTYYKDVLNAIYLLQPRNPDGSPVYDHYFNYELYRMFLQLSLLRLPETAESNPTTDEVPHSITATRTDMRGLHTILKDPARSDACKKMPEASVTEQVGILLGSMAKVNFHQAAVLSKVIKRLQHPITSLPLSLIRGNISLEVHLKKALLAYLQDPEMLNKTWDEKNITNKFLHYLQRTVTGKEQDTTDTGLWQQLAETITADESGHAVDPSPKKLIQALTSPSVSRVSMQESLTSLMDKHPEELLAWLEQEADSNEIIRMAEVTDHMQITYWTDCLALTPGFDQGNGLRQLIAWLLQRMPAREVATALFLYVKEPGWKTFTMEQTETYFFSRLYGQTDVLPPVETLADKDLPETMQKRLFHRYLRYQPEKLLAYLREASSRNTLPTDEWLPKTDISDWLYLAASLSLAKAELLRQITDSLSLPEEERKKALVTYLLHSDTKEWPYITPQETIRDFFKVMPSMQHVASEKKEEVVCQVINRLNLSETEIASREDQPEILTISNAGLCLLAPWFVRLFAMLGYLDEERKQFRNTASKVRAVFLLQYLVCGEEKPWREIELTFNRLLTALPGHVPLPKYLSLTDEERQTADSMAAGVKANWQQMNGTSVEGFRGSFLVRKGKLEQEEERWLLTVEEKAYDILLETIPWGFRQIRLPWLKKYVQVKWHEKQIF